MYLDIRVRKRSAGNSLLRMCRHVERSCRSSLWRRSFRGNLAVCEARVSPVGRQCAREDGLNIL